MYVGLSVTSELSQSRSLAQAAALIQRASLHFPLYFVTQPIPLWNPHMLRSTRQSCQKKAPSLGLWSWLSARSSGRNCPHSCGLPTSWKQVGEIRECRGEGERGKDWALWQNWAPGLLQIQTSYLEPDQTPTWAIKPISSHLLTGYTNNLIQPYNIRVICLSPTMTVFGLYTPIWLGYKIY